MTFIATSAARSARSSSPSSCAALLALVLTPLVRRVVLRYEIVDRPEARRVNTVPVPRGGGLAVSAAFLLVAGVFLLRQRPGRRSCRCRRSSRPSAVVGAAARRGAGGRARRHRRPVRPAGALAAPRPGRAGVGAVAARHHHRLHRQPVRRPGSSASTGPIAAGFTVFWIVGMINSINWIDGLDGLSSGDRVHRGGDARAHQPDDPGRPAAHRGPVLRAGRGAARVPALELPPGDDLRRDQRRPVRRLHAGGARRSSGRPRSRSRCSSSACRSSTRSGSSSGACRRAARRSARTGATSTTGCSTSACRTARRSSSIYGICLALAVLSLLLSGRRPSCTRSSACSSPSGSSCSCRPAATSIGPTSSRRRRTSPNRSWRRPATRSIARMSGLDDRW